jgi:hypothetical protein
MRPALLEAPVRYWKCPSCDITDRTQQAGVHTQFHSCPALGNVNIPLVELRRQDAKPDGRQVVVNREDGPGVASIRTERGDGSNDCTVFAPTASVSSKGH